MDIGKRVNPEYQGGLDTGGKEYDLPEVLLMKKEITEESIDRLRSHER